VLRRGNLLLALSAVAGALALFWLAPRPGAPALDGDMRSLGWYSPTGELLEPVSNADAPYADIWFGPDEATAHAVLGGTNEGLWQVDLNDGTVSAMDGGAPSNAPEGFALRHAAGNWLVFDVAPVAGRGSAEPSIWLAPRDGSGPARAFPALPWPLSDGRLSADQRWMAYVSEESGPREVYITTVPDGESRWLVSLPDGGRRPVWRSDSQQIYYWAPGGRLMVSALRRGDKFVLPALATLVFERADLANAPFAVTRDASRILIAAPR
jgi:hypothetical protein